MSTIQLKNRSAEEVIPIIEPMLGESDALTGQAYTIFLHSSPQTAARVKQMIAVIDAPAKMLQVSVVQGSASDLRRLGVSGSVQYSTGDASVEIGSGGDNGGSITYSTSDGSAGVSGVGTQHSQRNTPVHQVRVAEGSEAYIHTGSEIPYAISGLAGRRVTGGGVEYKAATSGFYVLPRVRGDNVFLEVSPFSMSVGTDGGIDTRSANTTITGPIGEWLMIGGVSEQVERSDSTIGSRYETRGRDESGIWIRADLVE